MTDKEKIKAEIERRRSLFRAALQDDAFKGKDRADVCLRYEELGNILDLIDSLPEEPVSEDYKKARKEAMFSINEQKGYSFKLQDMFDAGANWKEQQLMKKAVEVTVHIEAGNYPYIPQMELYDYDKDIPLAKEGDKYKVVLIKEE